MHSAQRAGVVRQGIDVYPHRSGNPIREDPDTTERRGLTPMTRHTTRLRQLLADPTILVAPDAYDGTGTRIAESRGFEALYVSGFETSASVLGQRAATDVH
jgi:hypothetical protein